MATPVAALLKALAPGLHTVHHPSVPDPWRPLLPNIQHTMHSGLGLTSQNTRSAGGLRPGSARGPLPSEKYTSQQSLFESQGHHLVLTVLCVPYSLDSGMPNANMSG